MCNSILQESLAECGERYESKNLLKVVEGCSASALSFAAIFELGPDVLPAVPGLSSSHLRKIRHPKVKCSRAFTDGDNSDYPKAFS